MTKVLERHKSSKPSFFKVLIDDFSEQLVSGSVPHLTSLFFFSFFRLKESLTSYSSISNVFFLQFLFSKFGEWKYEISMQRLQHI